ncbi:MAG: pyridoxal phosphate-dependent aminotransferase [Euryarchaeota archaeon]|nr:pyridoxal phosphate-dependent aminotransferase [Euryarchaeota archaeon]
MRGFAERAGRLVGQAPFKTLAKAQELERKGCEILHFEIGEPDFDTPRHVLDAGQGALMGGKTHYSSPDGLHDLRLAVCDEVERTRGYRPDIGQVLVTPGANPIIYFAVSCLAGPKDEVICPDPGFITYYAVLDYLGVKTVRVPLLEKNEFRMSPDHIRDRITKRTKLIILNSPQNPTGSVMCEEEIEEVAGIAEENDIYLLSDEIYGKLTYDTPHHSASVRDRCKERTILLDGFSKAYAMTGWRLGYSVAPEPLTKKMSLLLQTIVSCTTTFVQWGGVTALKGDQGCISDMMREFRERRDVIVSGLNGVNDISCVTPQGAFYVFPNIKKTGMTSQEFADHLLEELGIAVLPGTAFGPAGEGYIRMSYATSINTIEKAMKKMKEHF